MESKPFAWRKRGVGNSSSPQNQKPDSINTPSYRRPSILLPLAAIVVVASWNLFVYTKTNITIPLAQTAATTTMATTTTTTMASTTVYKVTGSPTYFVGRKNMANISVHLRTEASPERTNAEQDVTLTLPTHQYVVYPPNTGLDAGDGGGGSSGGLGGDAPRRFRVSSPFAPDGNGSGVFFGENTFSFPVTTSGIYRVYIEDPTDKQQYLLYTFRGLSDPLSNPALIFLLISFALMVGFFRKMFRRERNFTFLFIYAIVLLLICLGIFGIVSEMADYKKPQTGVEQFL